eukprot:1863857-Lingulodinium_polyedra.AAC.1
MSLHIARAVSGRSSCPSPTRGTSGPMSRSGWGPPLNPCCPRTRRPCAGEAAAPTSPRHLPTWAPRTGTTSLASFPASSGMALWALPVRRLPSSALTRPLSARDSLPARQ